MPAAQPSRATVSRLVSVTRRQRFARDTASDFPQSEDNSRPLKGQGSYGGLVILASHALSGDKRPSPTGSVGWTARQTHGTIGGEIFGNPPEVCHRRLATAFHDRGDAGEGQEIFDVLMPRPIRAQRTDEARGMDRACPGNEANSGKSHIPPNYVVEGVPAQRKPPEVRICRLSIQSGVGTRPPSTSTPHWPACRARR